MSVFDRHRFQNLQDEAPQAVPERGGGTPCGGAMHSRTCTRMFAPNDQASLDAHSRRCAAARVAVSTRGARNQQQRGAHPAADLASTDPPGNDPEGINDTVEGIDVYIVDSGGQDRAQSNDPEFGRSVLFADGMEYTIKITNDKVLSKHTRIAVNAFIDGNLANLTPLIVGASRTIEGFTTERHTTEDLRDGRSGYIIENTFKTFVAKKPETTGSVTNRKIGQVKLVFFAVKMATMYDGRRTRDHASARPDTHAQGCAQAGVMQTLGRQEVTRAGSHFSGGNRKPVADIRRTLGSFKLIICDQSRTLLDFMPNPPAGVSSVGPVAPSIDLPDQLRQLQEQQVFEPEPEPEEDDAVNDIYSLDNLDEYGQDLR